MKAIIKTVETIFLALFFVIFVLSCSTDDSTAETVEKEINIEDTLEDPVSDATSICNFSLRDVKSNSTIIIDCILDLEGQIINLPENVAIECEGGKIINGEITFSENTTVDGDILNETLIVGGTIPQLKDKTFTFKPSSWGIKEGIVADDVALNNRNALQSAIDIAKSMQVEVFKIDTMDAYFHFNYEWNDSKGYDEMAIHLPSKFHLMMGENTHIRLQPNNWPKGRIISVYEKEGVKISGGHIYGDRFTHDYSDILDEVGISRGSHEWPGLIVVCGSSNIEVDNVYLTDSTGDGFIFGASNGFRHRSPNKSYNQRVFLKNSVVNASRRNNISITDGENLFVENCTISDAGNGENLYDSNSNKIISSAGIAPKVGIDIEPFRGWNETDGFIWYEKVETVNITGCTFINNNVSSLIDYAGVNVTVENCISDNGFTSSFSTRGRYINNTLTASEKNISGTGITMGSMDVTINGAREQLSSDNVVKNNKISGFLVGLEVRGKQGVVSGNEFTDFWLGLKIRNAEETKFESNSYKSSRLTYSEPIGFAESISKNLVFNNMIVEVPRRPLSLNGLNNTEDSKTYTTTFNNCKFKSEQGYSLLIKNTPNVTFFKTELLNTKFDVIESSNFINN